MPTRQTAPILDIALVADSRRPMYRQLYEAIREAILKGRLTPGSRLPASRTLAGELDVSRNTVQGAFDQLFAEGYLETRQGSGTYVASDLPDAQLHTRRGTRRVSARPQSLEVGVGPHEWNAFRPDYPDISEFPFATWTRLLRRNWSNPGPELLGYGDPRGYQPLRTAIAEILDKTRSVDCSPEQILVLPNTRSAVSLIATVLLQAGDSVLFENPGYPRSRQTIEQAGASIVPVPVDAEGMDIGRVPASNNPRLACVTPSHQFPLGHLMSLSRRLSLLDWAGRNDAWVLEDDYGTYFRYAGRPVSSLQGLDKQGRVLYVGTFSRVIFPAIRTCYLVVPSSLLDAFVQARLKVDHHATSVEQSVLADFIAEGHFTRHIRRMRKLYAERQTALIYELNRHLSSQLCIEPADAGMHVVANLRDGHDDQEIEQRAAEIGISVRALSSYFIKGRRRRGLVLGYAHLTQKSLRVAVRQLASLF